VFELDPQLEADTFPVGITSLNRILLMNDSRFPWLILVPERPDIREPFELTDEDQRTLMQESMITGKSLKALFNAHKLNIAALGNQVSQLHIHHIARFRTDAAWPRPVWGVGAAEPYEAEALRERVALLREVLSNELDLELPTTP
jgi:diadenosine tetraphosphate (Ap4A) HIT family hydrolase